MPEESSPWIGEDYSAGINGVRLLVLGESSYGESASSPANLVQWHISLASGRWGRTYSRFVQILSEDGQWPTIGEPRRAVWRRVAFMNFLAEAAALRPRMKPSPESWARSLPVFETAMNRLSPSPDGIIVWGYRLWYALEKRCQCLKGYGDNIGHLALTDGRKIPAFALKHPSLPSTSAVLWRPRLAKFIADLREGQFVLRPAVRA